MWQAVGVTQWWRISDQRSAAGPRAPLSASVAAPENAMTSPTPQRAVASGAEMVGCGGVLPGVTTTESVAVEPAGSRTRSTAVTLPATV